MSGEAVAMAAILRDMAADDEQAECLPEEHDAWAAADLITSQAAEIEQLRKELSDWKNGHANGVRAHAAALARAETAEASFAAAQEALDIRMAEFRDKVALGASDAEILRFRDGYPNPAGGSKILYRHSIEQARYRYADAVIAARTLTNGGENGR